VLLADDDSADESFVAKREFAMKFQQFSAPIQAKGIEDTAFYRYVALLSLNEVGGDPATFGTPVDDFHGGSLVRREQWRHEMTTTATHDTKRGEDARARLNVLSEMPGEWRRAVMTWRQTNAFRRTVVDRNAAPDANDEYLFYQALVGAWPPERVDAPIPAEAPIDFVERIKTFMSKAIREAKTHTSWLNQNRAYEDAVATFVEATLSGSTAERFLNEFVPFARQIACAGMVNSLSQLVLKVAAPGVPDFYQGSELWQLDFADPDNRRPVDFQHRIRMLTGMQPWLDGTGTETRQDAGDGQASLVERLLNDWPDGRIKMFITAAAIRVRRSWPQVFVDGSYVPLVASGPASDHIVAFVRQHGHRAIVAVVPRLSSTLRRRIGGSGPGEEWTNTTVLLPEVLAGACLKNVVTGEVSRVTDRTLEASALFRSCPVALLATDMS
jgi:(1->4)-alpha-D-glucan 1-alpha-D-glucosylmutase